MRGRVVDEFDELVCAGCGEGIGNDHLPACQLPGARPESGFVLIEVGRAKRMLESHRLRHETVTRLTRDFGPEQLDFWFDPWFQDGDLEALRWHTDPD